MTRTTALIAAGSLFMLAGCGQEPPPADSTVAAEMPGAQTAQDNVDAMPDGMPASSAGTDAAAGAGTQNPPGYGAAAGNENPNSQDTGAPETPTAVEGQ